MSDLSKIDALINAARARKAAKEAAGEPASAPKPKKRPVTDELETSEPKPRKEKPSKDDPERAAKRAQIEQEREQRKQAAAAAREEARIRKQAERELSKASKPAHMSKVDRAAAKLPKLLNFAQSVYDDVIVNMGAEQLNALAQHILHYNRVKATERALGAKLEVGQTVRIIGGDPKALGKVGTVTEVRRIRCFVELEGASKPVYLFTSDVETIAVEEARTGTEG